MSLLGIDEGTAVLRRWETLRNNRGTWDSHWQEVTELVRPSAADFNNSQMTKGAKRNNRIFDGTALWSLNQFAAGLHSYVTPPTDRWFQFTVEDPTLLENEEVIAWLELASDIVFWLYAKPEANLNPVLHEGFLDLGAFGNLVIFQDWNVASRRPIFRTYPLAHTVYQENDEGLVDTVMRSQMFTTRQAQQMFGDQLPDKIRDAKDPEKEWEFVHAVFPREDVKWHMSKAIVTNMPFRSLWISCDGKKIVRESGFHEMPYHIARWERVAGEAYGRGPAMTCLPDIKMINAMAKTVIQAAQKAVAPPMVVPSDGILLPVRTVPDGLIFKEPGSDPITQLPPGRIDIGVDLMDRRKEHIQQSFYVDLMRMWRKTERMTQMEVAELRNDQLRNMSPMLGRIHTELLSPMVRRTARAATRAGLMPELPPNMEGQKIRLEYVSPAARAQEGTKAMAIQQFVQDLVPFAQVDPSILDPIDWDAYSREMAKVRGVSRRIIRGAEQIEEIRNGRKQAQQMQQMQQMAASAAPAAGAIRDIAAAQKDLGAGGMGQ